VNEFARSLRWRLLGDARVVIATVGVLLLIAVALTPFGGRIDAEVTGLVAAEANGEWDPLLKAIEVIGQRAPLTVLVLMLGGLLAWRRRSWQPVLLAVATPIVFTLVVGGLKVTLGRGFPHEPGTGWWDGGLAFPSGHAAGAVAFWGIVATMLVRLQGQANLRTRAMLWLPWAVVLTCSLLRGTHWAADLLAGGLVGYLVLKLLLHGEAAACETRPLAGITQRLATARANRRARRPEGPRTPPNRPASTSG
jgi:undecaprenyl-diphosphatase